MSKRQSTLNEMLSSDHPDNSDKFHTWNYNNYIILQHCQETSNMPTDDQQQPIPALVEISVANTVVLMKKNAI